MLVRRGTYSNIGLQQSYDAPSHEDSKRGIKRENSRTWMCPRKQEQSSMIYAGSAKQILYTMWFFRFPVKSDKRRIRMWARKTWCIYAAVAARNRCKRRMLCLCDPEVAQNRRHSTTSFHVHSSPIKLQAHRAIPEDRRTWWRWAFLSWERRASSEDLAHRKAHRKPPGRAPWGQKRCEFHSFVHTREERLCHRNLFHLLNHFSAVVSSSQFLQIDLRFHILAQVRYEPDVDIRRQQGLHNRSWVPQTLNLVQALQNASTLCMWEPIAGMMAAVLVVPGPPTKTKIVSFQWRIRDNFNSPSRLL